MSPSEWLLPSPAVLQVKRVVVEFFLILEQVGGFSGFEKPRFNQKTCYIFDILRNEKIDRRILTFQAFEIPTFDFCKRWRVCRCLAKAASARSCASKSPVEEKPQFQRLTSDYHKTTSTHDTSRNSQHILESFPCLCNQTWQFLCNIFATKTWCKTCFAVFRSCAAWFWLCILLRSGSRSSRNIWEWKIFNKNKVEKLSLFTKTSTYLIVTHRNSQFSCSHL